MKRKFPFNINTTPNLYAESVEELIKLCRNAPDQAYEKIWDKRVETWLQERGETQLSNIVQKIRDSKFTVYDLDSPKDLPPQRNRKKGYRKNKVNLLCNKLSRYLRVNKKKNFELLDIDKAIDITLKEYETLRTEILQNSSEVSQLILLGLAAIFTIASIGLAPLADFLTVEDTTIQMPLYLEDFGDIIANTEQNIIINDGDLKIYNEREKTESIKTETEPIELREFLTNINSGAITEEKRRQIEKIIKEKYKIEELDIDTAKVIIIPTQNDIKYSLKITRATNGKTIEKQGIVPNIVIFNWLIPGLSLYLIYRSLSLIQKNKSIGIYIYYRVEKKLIKLSKYKAKYYLKMTDKDKFERSKLTNMGWENYIRQNPNYLEPLDFGLILIIFTIISLTSFVGGYILFLWDFTDPEFKLDSLLNILLNIFSQNGDGYSGLVVIPFFLWLIFFLLCLFKGRYIKNLDKPKKLNKISCLLNLFVIQIPIVFQSIGEGLILLFIRFRKYPKKTIYERLNNKSDQLIITIQRLDTNLRTSLQQCNTLIGQLENFFKKLEQPINKIDQNNVLNELNQIITVGTNSSRTQLNFFRENMETWSNDLNDNGTLTPAQLDVLKKHINSSIMEFQILSSSLSNWIIKVNNVQNKLKKMQLMKLHNLDFFPNKLNYLLEKMYFLLPEIFDFALINKEHFQQFEAIDRNTNKLSRQIIILQRFNKWGNPTFRFNGIFEDVLDDMWK